MKEKTAIDKIVRHRQEKSFPDEIREMTQLKALELFDDELTHIPKWISEMKNLNELNFSITKVNDIDNIILPKGLIKLYIGLPGDGIPSFIYELKYLEVLSIAGSKVYHLDLKQLSNLKKLRYLNLGGTKIFHEETLKLKKLRPDIIIDVEYQSDPLGDNEDLNRIMPGNCDDKGCRCNDGSNFLIHCFCDDCEGEMFFNSIYTKTNRGCCDYH